LPKILELEQHVADLIAAGEVVRRPASVVKELIENSIDAGASIITVEISSGGMSFIRVTDNGCGIDPLDAKTAFLRHATSKLHNAQGLEAINTLGFRGEALAAISAVARIELLTRETGADEGISLKLEAGEVVFTSPIGCPEGTTIIVRDLFFNTPARQKFRPTVPRALLFLRLFCEQVFPDPIFLFALLKTVLANITHRATHAPIRASIVYWAGILKQAF
jgi:DNA mismatch repair protein MutL